jgi:pimeloyl-ACP methyl ester carboxylesterase
MTHGWPGSVIEFHKVIGPLTDPRSHGGDPRQAFDLVMPSLPGYGFSERPAGPGWTTGRIADAWIDLMRRLGYRRFGAQGGDWGAAVTTHIAARRPPELAGIHLNAVPVPPRQEGPGEFSNTEKRAIADWEAFLATGGGYSAIQSTRPQTLGYSLTDSPSGQAAWILEKFVDHTDCGGDLLSLLSYDELLDNIMLYWLPATAASSARLYWESFLSFIDDDIISAPTGCSIFPREVIRPSRRLAEGKFANIVHWNELPRGGHFAAIEQPGAFVGEVRSTFRSLR